MPKNPPDGTQQVTTRIAYEDPRRAIEFLSRAFGFPEREEMRLEGANNSIIVTEVQVGDAYVMLGRAGTHGLESPAKLGASTASLIVYVDNIDHHYQIAKDNGAHIISEPSDQYWGDRRYEASDLEGHVWSFHERTRDVSRAEIERIEAGFKDS